MPTLTSLSPKEQRFVEEYPIDFNATGAAKRSGYKFTNSDSLRQFASSLLTKPLIAEAIEKRKQELLEQAGVHAVAIIREAARLGMSDIGKLFDADGNLKPIEQIDEDTRRCIASIEVEELWDGKGETRVSIGRLKKLKLWDKNAALDKLFRYLALYKDPGTKDNPVSHRVEIVYEKMHTQN